QRTEAISRPSLPAGRSLWPAAPLPGSWCCPTGRAPQTSKRLPGRKVREERSRAKGQEATRRTGAGGVVMNNLAIIGLSVLLCFIAFGIVAGNYITPRLQAWSREDAIKALVAPHMFRFVGLAFLMPGVGRQPCPRLLPFRPPM